jgi:hypothetical protein
VGCLSFVNSYIKELILIVELLNCILQAKYRTQDLTRLNTTSEKMVQRVRGTACLSKAITMVDVYVWCFVFIQKQWKQQKDRTFMCRWNEKVKVFDGSLVNLSKKIKRYFLWWTVGKTTLNFSCILTQSMTVTQALIFMR